MFNLIQLFLRLSGFFVFLLLEIICFTLVVKYNQAQKGIYTNSVNVGTGLLHKASANFKHYFSLDDENYRLARENAKLLETMYNLGIDTLETIDTIYFENNTPHYIFQVAKVIKNSVNNHHNYIVLDKGSDDGIIPHSGIVTNNGVVGIVRKVSKRFSVAMSLLHRQTRISAKIKGSNFPGSIAWDERENNTQMLSLSDIPKHAKVEVGDTVVTSGFSTIFPEGIMIGTVESTELKPGKYALDISVSSKLDMANIQYVYIVKNLFKKEQEDLEQAVMEEDQ